MTIQASTPRLTWQGDNVSTVFPVNIQGYAAADFLVETLVVASGLLTPLVLNSGYTMATSGSLQPTYWTLTLPAPLPIGTNLSVVIDPAVVQQSQYVTGQAFPSAAIQQNLDRLTQMIIRAQDQISRVIQFPDIDSASGELPSAALRANLFLGFDSNGNAITVSAGAGTANTQLTLGTALYPRTAAESAASVTPANPYLPSYNDWAFIGRYGGSLAVAIAVAAGNAFTLVIDTPIVVGSNLTVPATMALEFVGNGAISTSAGFTLVVNGPILSQQPLASIFGGAGTNTINNTGTTYIGGNLVVSGALSATGFLAPQAYNNTAAQTVTSSNALVNATGLVTPSNLVAGGRYLCQLRLLFSSATTINCGYKIALAYGGTFTTPPVAAGVGSQNGTGTGQASYNLSVLPISANQVAIGAQWDLSSIDVTFQAATAGILQVQFSQDVATSSTLSLQPGSLMILTRTG